MRQTGSLTIRQFARHFYFFAAFGTGWLRLGSFPYRNGKAFRSCLPNFVAEKHDSRSRASPLTGCPRTFATAKPGTLLYRGRSRDFVPFLRVTQQLSHLGLHGFTDTPPVVAGLSFVSLASDCSTVIEGFTMLLVSSANFS